MATASPDTLSKSERAMVVRALELFRGSVSRAARAEANSDVKAIRETEVSQIDALVLRFR